MPKAHRLQYTTTDLHLQDGSLDRLCVAVVQRPLLPLGNLLVLDSLDGEFAVLGVRATIRDILNNPSKTTVGERITGEDGVDNLDDAFDGNLVTLVVQAVSNDATSLVHHFNVKGEAYSPIIRLNNEADDGVVETKNQRFSKKK